MFGFKSGAERRLESVENRLLEVSATLERIDEIETTWLDYQHKFNNILSRLNQRDRAAAQAPSAPAGRPPNPAALRLLGHHSANGNNHE